jgi:hypothetical protein
MSLPAALRCTVALVAAWTIGCSGSRPPSVEGAVDAGVADGQPDAGRPGGGADAGSKPECAYGGAPGTCLTSSACAALADHSAETGSCPAGFSCCIDTPDLADNPPIPAGYKLMLQSQVTPAMTSWAVMILHDPVTYPMYATTTRMFGSLQVLASVQWHPPDFQNGIIHRGVTLFVPV